MNPAPGDEEPRAPKRASRSLLVLHPDPESLAFLVGTLSSAGYDAEGRPGGPADLSAAARSSARLLLLDAGLLGAFEGKGERPPSSKIEIPGPRLIVLESGSGPGEMARAFELGAADFLRRPFLAEELLARVEAQLRRGERLHYLEEELAASRAELLHLNSRLASSREETLRERGELEARRRRLESTLDLAMDGYWRVDRNLRVLETNRAYLKMSGYDEAEILGMDASRLSAMKTREEMLRDSRAALGRGPLRYETKHRRKDGRAYDVEVSVTADTESGDLVGFVRDISERKAAQARLVEELGEKSRLAADREILIRELRHRTRNNMSVILSLLGLESLRLDSPEMALVLRDMERRILSMSLAHDELEENSGLSVIDLGRYMGNLLSVLPVDDESQTERIRIETRLDSIPVLIDTALPCGLVVNELVTNALRYAFPADRRGSIRVGLARAEDSRIRLCVEDDGVGLPPGFDLRARSGLGFLIVFGLGESQLGAEIVMGGPPGFSCELAFTDNRYGARV